MPVQTDITTLSTTPASNSPSGGEAANLVDDYLRQLAAHIATLRMGTAGMGGPVLAVDGTNSAPAYAFAGATNTGNYRVGNAIYTSLAGADRLSVGYTNGTGVIFNAYVPSGEYIRFNSGAGGGGFNFEDRLRIDPDGSVRIGASVLQPIAARVNGFSINATGTGTFQGRSTNGSGLGTSGSTGTLLFFYSDNGSAPVLAGSISVSGSTTSYNTSSDARLKENIEDAPEAGDVLDAIKVRQFDWRGDGLHQRFGFVAQELAGPAPEAVTAPKSDDDYYGVDNGKLVPLLVKEIQSLRRRVAALEADGVS